MKKTKYVSKEPNQQGIIEYDDTENETWQILIHRQKPIVETRACREFLDGLDILNFPTDRVPQLQEINQSLQKATGWKVARVSALIGFEKFFTLLANREFPAATFIRTREELDYLQEPDIFHELFGHCPMLTNQVYANFMQKYGELGLKAAPEDRVMLARLYWFTVEFGLIKTEHGLKIYGGGILSSISETPYSLEDPAPLRKPFDLLEMFRTPYRIDILQTVYFIIDQYETLYEILKQDIFSVIQEARRLGMHVPTFSPKENGEGDEEYIC